MTLKLDDAKTSGDFQLSSVEAFYMLAEEASFEEGELVMVKLDNIRVSGASSGDKDDNSSPGHRRGRSGASRRPGGGHRRLRCGGSPLPQEEGIREITAITAFSTGTGLYRPAPAGGYGHSSGECL